MPEPPIATAKLFPPPHRANLVARLRLAEKFQQGIVDGHTLTLISAPAGFGKTTLVVDWLQQYAARPVAWLSLEPADNDQATFLRYLLAALHSVMPDVGHPLQTLLANGSVPRGPDALLPLLNELHAIRQPFFLVLDDYHAIQQPEIHELTAALLDRPPAALHTIITTRQDPLLPLARWRARGLLTEFRLGELRFTAAETAEFFQSTMRLPLSVAEVKALETRTEGWVAGLQMAAISLQQMEQSGERSDFIQNFTGDDRFIMDYLIDEVINSQPRPVQEFLLHTSVLERFNAGLCSAVLQQPMEQTAAQLAYLERSNLFLIPLDHRSQWFRYHHLFADLLRYRLSSGQGSAYMAALQARAAQWCAENDLPEQAVAYAQTAGDPALTTALIRRFTPGLLSQGAFALVARWMRTLPEAVIRRDPFLALNYGDALTHTGQIQTATPYLRLAEEGFANDPPNLARTLLQAAHNALMRGEFLNQIDLAQRSLLLLPMEDIGPRGSASFYLGLGYLHNGEPQRAEIALRQALSLGQEAENPRAILNALGQLGRICILRLDFAQAAALFRRATAYLQSDGKPYPGSDMAFFDLAMLQYLQNNLDEAAVSVEAGLEANLRSGSAEMRSYGRRIEARLHQLAGRSKEAEEACRKALLLSASFDLSPLTLSLNAALQVQMAITAGDAAAANSAAPRVTNSLGLYPFAFYPELACVQLFLLQGRKEEAQDLLTPALERASQPGWEYPRLQVCLLQALAAGERSAQPLLQEALRLSLPAGAARAFLDLGEPLQHLLSASLPAIHDPELHGWAQALLALFPQPWHADSPQVHAVEQPLLEPLSEREIEVLRLIADGLSNTQIAERLVLSPNTLKAHTQNIYGKLDVHSRVQAVNRAREIQLI